jgi:hypothetical protein
VPGSDLYHHISWHETAVNMGWPKSEWPEFKAFSDPVHYMMPQVFDPQRTSAGAEGIQDNANAIPEQRRGKYTTAPRARPAVRRLTAAAHNFSADAIFCGRSCDQCPRCVLFT